MFGVCFEGCGVCDLGPIPALPCALATYTAAYKHQELLGFLEGTECSLAPVKLTLERDPWQPAEQHLDTA